MAGKGAKGQEQDGGLGQAALKSNATLAAVAMKGADPWQKLVVYCCYGIVVALTVVVSAPPYDATKQVICFCILALALCAAFAFVLLRYRHLSGADPAPAGPEVAALKDIVLAAATRDRMFEVLEEARGLVVEALRRQQPTLENGQVRANIFFPEHGRGGAYVLKIRPGLHCQMSEPELGIAFKPGQGLTGKVYQTGEPRVAQRLTSEPMGWDLVYKITPEIARIIHPELKWIVSMPLKGADNKPIGVMNIDGLTHQFGVDDLYACARLLTMSAIVLAGLSVGN